MPIVVRDRAFRTSVAILDADPPRQATQSLAENDLFLFRFDLSRATDSTYLGTLAASIVLLDPAVKLARAARLLDYMVERLLNHGCEVIVLATTQALPHFVRIVKKRRLPVNNLAPEITRSMTWRDPKAEELSPSCRFFVQGTPWSEIAKVIASRRVDDAVNLTVKLRGDVPRGARATLMKRAFAEPSFKTVHLTRLGGGYSGAHAFKAQVERSGGKPIPYFLKIGTRKKIVEEYNGFLIGVEPYVPFYLAPPMLKENCCLGSTEGLILEHYVTESESLLECAEGGRAISPISCLFSRTLNAWHRSTATHTLGDFVSKKLPDSIDAQVIKCAKALGQPQALNNLRSAFNRLGAPLRVPYSWIHGDLHAENIRIRANDAVIIDMEKHCTGPLLWDPACLECSFLIEGFGRDTRDPKSWFKSIKPCFFDEMYNFWSHEHLTDKSSWFHVAINQIRLFVRSMVRNEDDYLAVLAAALLWKAGKPLTMSSDVSTEERKDIRRQQFRRGAAYLIAQHLLERLEHRAKSTKKLT